MYFDKTGKEIKAGMILQDNNGDIKTVIKYDFDDELYFNGNKCIYPLADFNTNELTIIKS